MRMRRKKNLETRLDDCAEILIDCENEDLNFENAAPSNAVLDLKALFENDNPLVLEIGRGKGGFACEFAKRNPNVNVIAVEKVGNVIVAACEAAKQAGGAKYKIYEMQCRIFALLHSRRRRNNALS